MADLLDEYAAVDQAKQQAQYGVAQREQQEREGLGRLEAQRAVETTVSPASDSEGGSFPTEWVVFFLIFVVGNVVLYLTTGWVIIPTK